jgi:hypothetical protein
VGRRGRNGLFREPQRDSDQAKSLFSFELESLGNLTIMVNAGKEWGSCIIVLEAGERWALTHTRYRDTYIKFECRHLTGAGEIVEIGLQRGLVDDQLILKLILSSISLKRKARSKGIWRAFGRERGTVRAPIGSG